MPKKLFKETWISVCLLIISLPFDVKAIAIDPRKNTVLERKGEKIVTLRKNVIDLDLLATEGTLEEKSFDHRRRN